MVDINTTIIQFAEPIDNILNAAKVLVGGVFGIYLIILYIRITEYFYLKKMLKNIRNDLRQIAKKQRVELEPIEITTFEKILFALKKKISK